MWRIATVAFVIALFVASSASVRAGCIVGDPTQTPYIVLESVPPDCCYGAWAGEIVGHIVNVNVDSVYVAAYAQTNMYYVQPWADARRFTTLNCDGTFRISSRGGHHYCIVLFKRGGWDAPTPIVALPPVAQAILATACSPIPRYIQAFGSTWEVKTGGSERVGPGPNYFSDSADNVWVDEQGSMHLRITVVNGQPWCAEVVLLRYADYGLYEFEFELPGWPYDACTVLSGFIYQDPSHEIDIIEYSRWCGTVNANAQFVVQPWDRAGNLNRFTLSAPTGKRTHQVYWGARSIVFNVREGGLDEHGQLIQHWVYTGADNPPPGQMRFRFNAWMFNGTAPVDGQAQEVIISAFRQLSTAVEPTTWSKVKGLYR